VGRQNLSGWEFSHSWSEIYALNACGCWFHDISCIITATLAALLLMDFGVTINEKYHAAKAGSSRKAAQESRVVMYY